MRILVLGNSNSNPPDAERLRPWPLLAASLLEAKSGDDVEVSNRLFFPHADGAAAYVRSQVERFEPDVVVFAVTVMPGVHPAVLVRLQRVLGRRVVARMETVVSAVDWYLLRGGRLKRGLYHGLHAVGRRVFGTEASGDTERVIAGYREAINAVISRESITIAVLPKLLGSMELRRREPALVAATVRTNNALHEICSRRRLLWLENNHLDGAESARIFETDGHHLNARGQGLMAEAVARQLAGALS